MKKISKVEIDLPEKILNFYRARAVLKGKDVEEEIKDFLTEEERILIKEIKGVIN